MTGNLLVTIVIESTFLNIAPFGLKLAFVADFLCIKGACPPYATIRSREEFVRCLEECPLIVLAYFGPDTDGKPPPHILPVLWLSLSLYIYIYIYLRLSIFLLSNFFLFLFLSLSTPTPLSLSSLLLLSNSQRVRPRGPRDSI